MELKSERDENQNTAKITQQQGHMSPTVRELFALDPPLELYLAAGEGGLDRAVYRAATLEGGELFLNNLLQNVQPGDFVVCSLFFARSNSERFQQTLQLLVERGAAGLAIKTAQGQEIAPETKAFADEHNFPVFLFDKVLMADLLFYIHDILKMRRETVYFENCIRQILPTEASQTAILQALSEINPNFLPNYYCAYLTSDSTLSFLHLRDILSRLYQMAAERDASTFFPYDTGLLLLASFPESEAPVDVISHFRTTLLHYQVPIKHFYCGISRIHNELTELDVTLVEAFSANHLAQHEQHNLICYQDMGLYQLILPQLRSKSFQNYIRFTRETLLEYDKKYNSHLLRTLRTYIACQGKLAQTAEQLFLHVNTVRYRLNKAKELLHMDDFYIQAYIFVKANDFLFPES